MFNSTRPLFSPSSIHFFINFSNIFLSPLHLLASLFLSPSSSFCSLSPFPFALSNVHVHLSTRCSPHCSSSSSLPPPSWPHQREQRKSLRELKMWLDQLERDAIQAQETEGNLTQQYQVCVCVCVWVRVHFRLATLCTDSPIISLISGITLWGSDSSRSYFQSIWLISPSLRDIFHIQKHVGYPLVLCTVLRKIGECAARERESMISNMPQVLMRLDWIPTA